MVTVSDLVTDLDVLALDHKVLEAFGNTPQARSALADKRREAFEWIQRSIEDKGLDPRRHQLRRIPDGIYSLTGGTYTDRLDALSERPNSFVDAASLILTPANDALFVGLRWPFRGLAVVMLSSVNASTLSVASLTYWDGGQWASPSSLADGTRTESISLSKGGILSWLSPDDWQLRPYNLDTTQPWYHWIRLQLSVVPSVGTVLYQLTPIRTSRLTPAAKYKTLELMYLSGAVGGRSNYADHVERLRQYANDALTTGLTGVEDEFEPDSEAEKGAVAIDDVGSVVPVPRYPISSWERG